MPGIFRIVIVVMLAGAASAGGAQAGPLRDALFGGVEETDSRLDDGAIGKAVPGSLLHGNVAYGADEAQRLDVYVPPGARGAPVIVMVHGGAWRIGDKAMERVVRNKASHFLSLGFLFVSINYRMLPDAAVPEQAKDVASALRFVQGHAAAWGGDAAKLVLMGHSAGGHLAALLSADPSSFGLSPWSGTVALDSAVMDLPALMAQRHYRLYDRAFGKDEALWRAMSPLHRLAADGRPMLLICSTRRDDSCVQAHAFAAAAQAKGLAAGVREKDLSHGEINGDLGLPGAYTDAVDAFIAEVMK